MNEPDGPSNPENSCQFSLPKIKRTDSNFLLLYYDNKKN
jgi:hypothetical protein